MLAADPALRPAATLSDQIAYRLQRDILERRIGLGDHLAQDELCVRFGVSRTPIREALARLAASSLVDLRPNRGAIVRRPGRREIRELYELRAELEGFAAERAAARLDRATGRRLERLQGELSELLQERPSPGAEADDRSAFAAALGAANDAIHDLVLTVADNDALVQDVQRLRGRFPKDYVTEAAGEADELLALNVTEHEEILAALAEGDGRHARRAMTDHVAHAATLLTEHLERERFWE
jgi:DNA-binding GntR family transcriptional regulator